MSDYLLGLFKSTPFLILSSFVILVTAIVLVIIIPSNSERKMEFVAGEAIESDTSQPNILAATDSAEIGDTYKEHIFIQISGAVNNPQVVEIEEGTRVFEAIELAGGFAPNVSKEFVNKYLNMAEKVQDGQKLYIPHHGEELTTAPIATENTQGVGKVNVNTANAAELQILSGVGPITAEAIIDYRNKNGPFRNKEDLLNVSGIGPKTLEKFVDNIVL